MPAPTHYNPLPMFGLRVAPEPEPNVALYRHGALVGYARIDPGFLRDMLEPPSFPTSVVSDL